MKLKGLSQMPKVRRCRYPGCHALVPIPSHYCTQHYEHEAEYLANRQRWARSRDKNYQRKYNSVTRNRNADKSSQYNFYRSRQWVGLRKNVLERDYYLCQYCKALGKVTSAKTVDHIVPIEYAPSLKAELSNLATTCSKCHSAKTAWEREYYGTGKDNQLKSVVKIDNIKEVASLIVGY